MAKNTELAWRLMSSRTSSGFANISSGTARLTDGSFDRRLSFPSKKSLDFLRAQPTLELVLFQRMSKWPNVLLAEDSPEDAFFIERALKKAGFNGSLKHVNDG